jgi:hypothetical protein
MRSQAFYEFILKKEANFTGTLNGMESSSMKRTIIFFPMLDIINLYPGLVSFAIRQGSREMGRPYFP